MYSTSTSSPNVHSSRMARCSTSSPPLPVFHTRRVPSPLVVCSPLLVLGLVACCSRSHVFVVLVHTQIYLATLFLRLVFDPVNFQHADRERTNGTRRLTSGSAAMCKMRMSVVLRTTTHVSPRLDSPQNIYIYICIHPEGTCRQRHDRGPLPDL